jgi:purine nucleosidase
MLIQPASAGFGYQTPVSTGGPNNDQRFHYRSPFTFRQRNWTMKLLLDTDIGSDIDDAVCLAYLLAQPECELLGITTVSGEPEKRAMLASALCKAAGQGAADSAGCGAPAAGWQHAQTSAPQSAALARWPHETHFPDGHAIGFMREMIRRHPGDVALLAIGPDDERGAALRHGPRTPPPAQGTCT